MALAGAPICVPRCESWHCLMRTVFLAVTSVLALLVPGLALRRRAGAARFARLGFCGAGSADVGSAALSTCRTGPCVVVANHASYLDGVVMAAAAAAALRVRHQARSERRAGRGTAAAADRLGVRRPLQPPQRAARDARRVLRTRGERALAGVLSRRAPSRRKPGLRKISHRRVRHRGARAAAGRAGGDPRHAPRACRRARSSRAPGPHRASRSLEPLLPADARHAADAAPRCARAESSRGSTSLTSKPRATRRRAAAASDDLAVELHVAPVLPADLVERARDLPERADPHRLHQLGEHVAAATRRLPAAARSAAGASRGVARLEVAHARRPAPASPPRSSGSARRSRRSSPPCVGAGTC